MRKSLRKPTQRLSIITTRLIENIIAGNYRSVFRGRGMEYDETRSYVYGDDMRLIDWHISARMSHVYTKIFREEREMTLVLIVDVSPSLVFGSGDEPLNNLAMDVAFLLSMAAERNNDKVGLLLFTNEVEKWVPPRKGRRHILSLMNELQQCSPRGRGSDLGLALRTVSKTMKRSGICVILSDFLIGGYQRDLSILSRRHDVIAVRLFDAVQRSFPLVRWCQLEDPESRKTISISGRSHYFREQFREFWQNARRDFVRECSRSGINVLELSPEMQIADELIRFFKRRKQ